MAINLISSKETGEEHAMHSKTYNIKFVIYDEVDVVIQELFESLLSRYQSGLEGSVKGSNFIFDCVNLLHCKWHKTNLKRNGSDIDFPDWIKTQKQQ